MSGEPDTRGPSAENKRGKPMADCILYLMPLKVSGVYEAQLTGLFSNFDTLLCRNTMKCPNDKYKKQNRKTWKVFIYGSSRLQTSICKFALQFLIAAPFSLPCGVSVFPM